MKFKNDEDNDEKTPVIDEAERAHRAIDELITIGQSPSEQQRLRDNRLFIREIAETPLPDKVAHVKVFGVQDVNINAILKDNIWNRGIFTTDHLCRVAFQMRYEQIRKWLAQKRRKPFEHWMLVLIIIGVAVALVVILLLMSMDINLGGLFG